MDGFSSVSIECNSLVSSCILLGTNDGHLRQFPSKEAREHGGEAENELSKCVPYDPRVSDWFVTASTGPKDIVIVIDESGSMSDKATSFSPSKWELAQDAVVKLIDSFSFTDYVNIVTFSTNGSPIWTDSNLARATKENKERLKSLILYRYPGGGTNFNSGFEVAFDILIDGCTEEFACSNCQKIILFLTDGIDGGTPTAIDQAIESRQTRLKEVHGSRATIFTYSMTTDADDRIPRQIACANNGAWSFVDENTQTRELLGSYYRYIAVNRVSNSPVWTEPVFKNGSVVAVVSQPFYSPTTESVAGVFLGVVGSDVEIKVEGGSEETVEEIIRYIISRSGECSVPKDLLCLLQIFRDSSDKRAQCVDRVVTAAAVDPLCHKSGSKYYKVFSQGTDWNTASQNCIDDGGLLATANNEEELGFVASLSSTDGSWLGLSYINGAYRWENRTAKNVGYRSSYWGIGQPSNGYCITVDNRGKIGNLATNDCDNYFSYVCEYQSKGSCKAGVAKVPNKGYYSIPPLESCSVEEVREVTLPVPEAADLRSNQVVCCEDYYIVNESDFFPPSLWLIVALCMAVIAYYTE